MKLFKKYQDYIWITLLVSLSSLHLLYAVRTDLYFSVDDFAVLSYIRSHSAFDMFANFFINGDLFGFRKLLGYGVMKAIFDVFKVNPTPYILANHFLHTANILFLFFIVKRLTKNSFNAFFCSILFNKIYLFYFSNIHEYLACCFALLTILFYLKFPKKIYLSLAAFVLALLTKELTFSIPFIIASLALVNRAGRKSVLPFFGVLLVYCLYQLTFVLKGLGLPPQNASYQVSLSPGQVATSFIRYFPVPAVLLTFSLIVIRKKFEAWWLAASTLLTILPALLLPNRHEGYYLYIPFAYFAILLSTLVPKISRRTFALYILIVFVLGGRSVFPILARQSYPNWQKISMENVVFRVRADLENGRETGSISLGGINLERDAKLMLQSGTLDLFLPEEVASKYVFSYSEGENSIGVKLKI